MLSTIVVTNPEINITILIISDLGEGSDTRPKKLKHVSCEASYHDTGIDLAAQLDF